MVKRPSASKNGVGYFRVSTQRQAGAHHVSLETQKERFAAYCQANGLVPIRTFTDVDTGRRDNRREYQEMLQYLEDGGADFVVVQYLDRFGRNPREILRRIWQLQDAKVEVVATDEDIQEELMLLVRAGLAGAESKKTSERVRANMARAVSKGVHVGRVPFGFQGIRQIDTDGKARIREFVHDPIQVAAIREMYNLAVDRNLGLKSICDNLNPADGNGDGYLTRSGKFFEPSTVQTILTNESLKGTMVYGKRSNAGNEDPDTVRVDNFYPPILTDEEWARLQDRLTLRSNVNSKGRAFTSSYTLSGMARCGHCGGPMTGKTSNVRNYTYRKYYCSNAQRSRAKCAYYNGHSADTLEKLVMDTLDKYVDRDITLEFLSHTAESGATRKEEELREIEEAVTACEKEFQTHLNLLKSEQISEAQFASVNDPVKGTYDRLLKRRNELQEFVQKESLREQWREDMALTLTTFSNDLKDLPVAQQKARLMEIIEEITVYRHKSIKIRFRDLPLGV